MTFHPIFKISQFLEMRKYFVIYEEKKALIVMFDFSPYLPQLFLTVHYLQHTYIGLSLGRL